MGKIHTYFLRSKKILVEFWDHIWLRIGWYLAGCFANIDPKGKLAIKINFVQQISSQKKTCEYFCLGIWDLETKLLA
jgi:hypothetical protein